jgi:WD40 repeat protein
MSITRRRFVASLASAVTAGPLARGLVRGAETRVVSWPSRVVQLPPDSDNQKPPVVTAVRLHREGQLLATAGDDHCVHVWNLNDGRLVHKLEGHTDWVRSVDYSPDGRILVSAGNDRQIIFWNAADGTQLDVLPVPQAAIATIRFSHDGKLLATVGFEDVVRLYDTASKQLTNRLPAPCQDMRALVFSHDDRFLAVGGRCGSVRLYSMPRGTLLRDISAHRQRIRAIAFSSDGSYVASSGEDRLIHVAQISSGAEFSLPPRPAKVLSLAFYGPHQLATAGSDNQIRLWDVTTKDEIGCLRGHTGSVAALECRGKVLVSAGYDTTVRVWDVGDQIASGANDGPRRVGTRPDEPKKR